MKCLRWSRELRLSFGLHWAPGSGHIGLRVPNQNFKKILSFLLYFMFFVSSGPGAPGGPRSSRRIRRAIGCAHTQISFLSALICAYTMCHPFSADFCFHRSAYFCFLCIDDHDLPSLSVLFLCRHNRRSLLSVLFSALLSALFSTYTSDHLFSAYVC